MKTIAVFSAMLFSICTHGQASLIDINPGSQASYPEYFTPFNGEIYFRAYNSASGQDVLYKSDGTAAGTQLVKDVPVNVEYPKDQIAKINGLLIFTGYDAAHGFELWVSDGTTSGTVLLKDIISGPNSSFPMYITAGDNKVYFQANNAQGELELWYSDGTTAGTQKVKQIQPAISNKPPLFTYCNGLLFFISDDLGLGNELWRSDGTSSGTFLVKDINPGALGSVGLESDFTVFNNELYFAADDGTHREEVWKSDGTPAGTQMLADIEPAGGSTPASFTPLGNQLLFTAHTSIHGRELYRTDGTTAGTRIVKDIYPGTLSGIDFWYGEKFTVLGAEAYFQANDPEHGYELWKSDGTTGGTKLVADINPTVTGAFNSPESSRPVNLAAVNDLLFFAADQAPFTNNELFLSDGTTEGTRLALDVNPGPISSFPHNLTALNDMLFFRANDGTNGSELWVYKANQSMVTDFTLVDAVNNSDLQSLNDNNVINLAALPHRPINIRANVAGSGVGSVVFKLNGSHFRTESVAPYALAGDNPPGNYYQWNPLPGNYKICATPYSGPNGSGEPGIPTCISFILSDVSFGITHFTLVHADTDQDILNFRAGNNNSFPGDLQMLDLSGITDPHRLNIRANTYPPDMDQVSFGLDGDNYGHSEGKAPYALFGDQNGNYYAWQDKLPRALGEHYLVAWAKKGQTEVSVDAYFQFKYDIQVSNFSLVDAETDEFLQIIEDADIIDLAFLPTNKLNIVANTIPENVGSVVFEFRPVPFTGPIWHRPYENQAPYVLFGDNKGNFNEWMAMPGNYELIALPLSRSQIYPNSDLLGIRGKGLSINFDIIHSNTSKKSSIHKEKNTLEAGGFTLYPNPNRGLFEIALGIAEDTPVYIQITDLRGRVVYQNSRMANDEGLIEKLDLSKYTKGVYLLQVDTGKERFTKKVLVQ